MNKEEFDKALDYYTDKRKNGFGFSSIRKELTNQGLEDEKIRDLINLLSQREISEELRKTENSKSLSLAFMGLFLFLLGSSITIYSYINGKSQFVLWYGAILVGIGMFASGIVKYRK